MLETTQVDVVDYFFGIRARRQGVLEGLAAHIGAKLAMYPLKERMIQILDLSRCIWPCIHSRKEYSRIYNVLCLSSNTHGCRVFLDALISSVPTRHYFLA